MRGRMGARERVIHISSDSTGDERAQGAEEDDDSAGQDGRRLNEDTIGKGVAADVSNRRFSGCQCTSAEGGRVNLVQYIQ